MPISMRRKIAALLLPAVLGLVTLTGCSPARGAAPGADDNGAPHFKGPYATEFAHVFAKTKSEFVRKVLADEQITDAEYAEMEERFTTCLDGVGITFDGFQPDGSYHTSPAPNGGDTKAIVDKCSMDSGATEIGMLHDIMAVNPDNQDLPTLIAKCLVGTGKVPADYSRDAYESDLQGRFANPATLPTDLRAALETCSSDPLGLMTHG